MAVTTVGVVSDPIADMLTRIRNANAARHVEVRVPVSKLKLEIARVLQNEGYIAGYEMERNEERAGDVLKITFKARPDRTGLRVYARKTEIPRVLGGLGIAILSTSQGVMSGLEAQRAGVGGEVLAYVW
jgi:small subunit ribosomal protein S8